MSRLFSSRSARMVSRQLRMCSPQPRRATSKAGVAASAAATVSDGVGGTHGPGAISRRT